MSLLIIAVLLGIVEGLTEFLPVSSTGHLILATRFFGYDDAQWAVFNIVIQLGAILAIVVLYWRTFWAVFEGLLRRDHNAIHFVINLLVAFIPAAVIGVLLKKQIEANLANPLGVAWALIIGGVAIIAIERFAKPGEYQGIGQLSLSKSLAIGFVQCLAMFPGVSRSGATIMGAMLMGVNRRTAAEFSFFLAIPTMLGATVLQVGSHWKDLAHAQTSVGIPEIAVGFVVSFIVALVIVKGFVAYIGRHGFTPFAIYRILAGAAAIYALGHMG